MSEYKYEPLEIEIIAFDAEDVITTSLPGDGGIGELKINDLSGLSDL